MKNPVISTYLKVVGDIENSLPTKGHVVKFIYHLGRAVNEVSKGVKGLRKKTKKEENSLKPKRIKIE